VALRLVDPIEPLEVWEDPEGVERTLRWGLSQLDNVDAAVVVMRTHEGVILLQSNLESNEEIIGILVRSQVRLSRILDHEAEDLAGQSDAE
jgi:hypothetical protein